MANKTAIVIGAGIVGLATARALALKGYGVTVIERSSKAVGASIRNFGMLWPVGQPGGTMYNRALRSRQVWKEVADNCGIWYEESGSLHLAHHADEWQVLQELEAIFKQDDRPVSLLSAGSIADKFAAVNTHNLQGGLYSATEMIVDPREAIATIPYYLAEELGVEFIWGKCVSNVEEGMVWTGNEYLQADIICVCSGADFETLFPEEFLQQEITKCKLQMMRFTNPEGGLRIGTSLCGGLSLIHYNSFKAAPSLKQLQLRYQNEKHEYLDYGIHVMVSENESGELTIGDSHEYGHTFDPFNKAYINQLIMDYLKQFMNAEKLELVETWYGIYPKMTNGATDLFLSPRPGVFIINGIGGAGMTLSFGFAEECADSI